MNFVRGHVRGKFNPRQRLESLALRKKITTMQRGRGSASPPREFQFGIPNHESLAWAHTVYLFTQTNLIERALDPTGQVPNLSTKISSQPKEFAPDTPCVLISPHSMDDLAKINFLKRELRQRAKGSSKGAPT